MIDLSYFGIIYNPYAVVKLLCVYSFTTAFLLNGNAKRIYSGSQSVFLYNMYFLGSKPYLA